MGVRTSEGPPLRRARPAGPGLGASLVVGAIAFLLLIANGRPIGAPQVQGAAGAVLRATLALVGLGFHLDPTVEALVGKLLGALCAAIAAGALFAAASRLYPVSEARWAGVLLALGTTLAAAGQTWTGEAPATAAVALALWLVARAEAFEDPAPAARAGFFLGLAMALQPTTVALAVVLVAGVLVRWRRPGLLVLAWAAPGAIVLATTGLPGLGAAEGAGALALLVSPAKGAFVFAPVALVGLAGALRALRPLATYRAWDRPSPGRWLPAACLSGAVAHFAAVAFAGGWADGVFWGPRLVAPAWPLLLLFFPGGLALLKMLGTLLALVSLGVQAIGALAYDGRWDRLHRSPSGTLGASVWSIDESPIVFQVKERVMRLSLPAWENGHLVVRERVVTPSGATGSFVSFAKQPVAPTGADATMQSFRLDGGARVVDGHLDLRSVGDGLAFRVRDGALPRRLEVRLVGKGTGTLGIGESDFFTGIRWRDREVKGPFRLRLPYDYPDSGGQDVLVRLRAGGPLAIESVALVPPGEPENVIRLP
jgi:Dolichyl-phosphate-mannose-protein mannosyltransferase